MRDDATVAVHIDGLDAHFAIPYQIDECERRTPPVRLIALGRIDLRNAYINRTISHQHL